MFATHSTHARVQINELAAKPGTALADALHRMAPGDHVIPLYESGSAWAEVEPASRDGVAGHVPHVLRVTGHSSEQVDAGEAEIVLPVAVEGLTRALPAADFLRLRTLSDTVASQFKGSAPARPIQEVARDVLASVRAATQPGRDERALLRSLSLVAAQNTGTAAQLLTDAGRPPRVGDMVFLVTRAAMPGLALVDAEDMVSQPAQPIARTPEHIRDLLIDAQRKATPSDPFNAAPAIEATEQLLGLLNEDKRVKAIDDFASFYEYRTLARVVTQAIELAKRPLPADSPTTVDAPEVTEDANTAAALQGLSVEAVLAQLPDGFSIERSVVAAAVASLRAGKHLLLGGPPGTGKTTLAEALCRAVVASNYDVTTATADWTTFDTIGGYLPDKSGLKFVPGVVLRSLRTNGWLVIDEVNRADIDKAFGPLFTVLSGGEGTAGRTSVLPYSSSDGNPVTIEWASNFGGSTGEAVYAITPSWRLIGTLNVSDKASLFRLSFAFLRRFAVIDVPLPAESDYTALFARWFAALGREDVTVFVKLAMAVVEGPVPIGPAIGRDFSQLIIEGLTETASGEPTFSSDEEAILTATRLLIVPQYEGQPLTAGKKLLSLIDEVVPSDALPTRLALETALHEVALS